jgi:ABC-type bacteriocin/lantibiotic exporter with double-glycine peptidase domain
MNHNYKLPETEFSCGATALRNCIIHTVGQDISEKTVRKYCSTNKGGTDEIGLIEGCQHFGFIPVEYEGKSFNVFKRKIYKGLREGKVFIVSTEHHGHWVAILDKKGKRVKVIDGDYRKYEDRSIVQYITMKELSNTAFGYDKFEKKSYYYFLELKYGKEIE